MSSRTLFQTLTQEALTVPLLELPVCKILSGLLKDTSELFHVTRLRLSRGYTDYTRPEERFCHLPYHVPAWNQLSTTGQRWTEQFTDPTAHTLKGRSGHFKTTLQTENPNTTFILFYQSIIAFIIHTVIRLDQALHQEIHRPLTSQG